MKKKKHGFDHSQPSVLEMRRDQGEELGGDGVLPSRFPSASEEGPATEPFFIPLMAFSEEAPDNPKAL